MSHYLSKPFDIKDLKNLVINILKSISDKSAVD
jgi:YesN/AraC family two-component response regulator